MLSPAWRIGLSRPFCFRWLGEKENGTDRSVHRWTVLRDQTIVAGDREVCPLFNKLLAGANLWLPLARLGGAHFSRELLPGRARAAVDVDRGGGEDGFLLKRLVRSVCPG